MFLKKQLEKDLFKKQHKNKFEKSYNEEYFIPLVVT